MLKKSEIVILKYLSSNKKATVKQMEDNLGISSMGIRTSIKSINEFLSEKQMVEIKKEKKEYVFNLSDDEMLRIESGYLDTAQARKDYIALELIFTGSCILTSKLEIFDVTRKTINNDLLNVKKLFSYFDLQAESQHGKGIVLKGDPLNIIEFASKIMGKILLERENFETEDSEPNGQNYFIDFYRKHIPLELERKAKDFIKELIENIDLRSNPYYFNEKVASVLFLSVRPELFHEEEENMNCVQEKYWKNIAEHLERYPELYFLKGRERVLDQMLQENSRDFKMENFFAELQTKFGAELDFETKSTLHYMQKIISYKSVFDIRRFNISLGDLPEIYNQFSKEIQELYNSSIGPISEEDLVTLVMFLKDIIKPKDDFKKINVLLIDPTLGNLYGKGVKIELQENYQVEDVEIQSVYRERDWNEIKRKFDMVFILDNFNVGNNFCEDIPCHNIKGIEHSKDRYFFYKFGLEPKINGR